MSVYWFITSFTWLGLIIALVIYIFISKIGADIGVHRYFCHKSFVAKPWAHKMFLGLSILGGFGSAVHYTAVHRLHHVKADTPEDPHSPHFKGALNVWLLKLGDDWTVSLKYVKDLIRDKNHVFLYKNHFKLYLSYILFAVIIAVIFGWQWLVCIWALPAALAFHTSSALNVICHLYGYQTHKTRDKSTNNTWLNFITGGSALHHNHHAFPNAYSHAGEKWYEFDLWGWLIKHVFMVKE